jgi:catechol 2,3-dioxygenase-like lactoylglutathione lyase family enzyme
MGASSFRAGPFRGTERRRFLKHAARAGAALAATGLGHGVGRAQASPSIVRFDHVAVPMRNTGAMVAFYRDLGFEVMEGDRICSVHFGDNKINFHRPQIWESGTFTLRAPAATPPCGDFCFVWGGSAAELEQTLERVGAVVIEGPAPRQGGRNGGVDTGTSRYIRDPDGNLLEFIIYS